jgi:hypothetical protein
MGFSFYGQTGLGFSYFSENTPRPGRNGEGCALQSGAGCVTFDRNSFLFNALAGARSRGYDSLFFMAHYKYAFFWDVDAKKAQSPSGFLKSPRDPQSPLPTRGLLRVHEFFGDARYLAGSTRFGLQLQYAIGRTNSSMFAQEGELKGTSFTSEAFVPYVIVVGGRIYRARLYAPFYTVVNHEDRKLTYTTFDFKSVGRGPVFSMGLSNLFYVPPAESIASLDLTYLDYKFHNVSNDRTRIGGSAVWTWTPRYFFGGSLAPKFAYYRDAYYLPTAVIPGWDPKAGGNVNKAQQRKRVDNILTYGGLVGIEVETLLAGAGLMDPVVQTRHRVSMEAMMENRSSTLPDYPSRVLSVVMRYLWTFPSTGEAGRFLRNTERNPLNGTFEGDGGF